MKTQIRDATLLDVETISNIHALSWKQAYKGMVPQRYLDELENDFWVSAFKNWINNNILKVKLICADATPVGCITYGKSRDEMLPEWAEIVSLYIHPDYFRKGCGQKLLDVAFADLKNDGYQSCFLWVLKENKNAQQFYEKNGFSRNQDEYSLEIQGVNLTDIRYLTSLNSY